MLKIVSILLLCIAGGTYSARSDSTCKRCLIFVNRMSFDENYYNLFKSESESNTILGQLIDSDVSSKNICELLTICEQDTSQINEIGALVRFRHHTGLGKAVKNAANRAAKAGAKAAACAA